MDWLQVLVMTFGNIAWILPMFFWIRSEARSDARFHDQEVKELRREMIDIMREMKEDVKDFHGRLCAIEERRKS